MPIAKLVKSNSHTDYVCQVFGPGEVERPSSPADYAFGTFVRLSLDNGGPDPVGALVGIDLVGIIYDTLLLNPDFGSLGPRLSPTADLAIFSPDYLAEKVTLVGVAAIGTIGPSGTLASGSTATHGVPPLAAQIDTLVEGMDDDAVRAFHTGPDGTVRLGYTPLLLATGSPLARHLLIGIIDRLQALFPDEEARLAVLRGELLWQATVQPVGGMAT